MRPDFDLQFLQYCGNEELRTLCDILTYDNDGKIRMNEGLTNCECYIECYPNNMVGMWKDLASELQSYGGNSILNALRKGHGPSYESIVYDVCKRVGVKGISKHDTAEEMETKLLLLISTRAIGELTEDDVRSIMLDCDIHGYEYTKAGLIAALMGLHMFNRRLFIILIQEVMNVVSRILVGRGVMMVGFGVLGRGIGVLCGPLGWLLLGGWTLWDLMGPAYRVTIPAVVQIALMRAKFLSKSNSNSTCA